ncbi:PspC domain-containing protein [Nocardioides sp. SYSU DS0651]|uniref:PspC domain-containing protein n=1 Tax=Nocardioides sp. SYSU DS0651 TaxID=3415955 RepID=UPI003F4BD933
MSTTPPEAPTEAADPREPGDHGPRVTKDEVRDLARIRRSRTDRKVAGVAGGLARHLDIDPLLLRVAFVVLTFFGGGGLILYGVAWLIVPEDETDDAVVRLDDSVRAIALIVTGVFAAASIVGDSFGGPAFPWPLIVVGGVLLVVFASRESLRPGGPRHPWLRGETDEMPHPATGSAAGSTYPGYRPAPPPPARPGDPRRRGPLLFLFTLALAALGVGVLGTVHLTGADVPASAYPATVMAVCGLMLLVGACYGRAGGLILVGLLAALATAASSVAAGVDVGEIRKQPERAAQLAERYELGAGDIRIDLTRVEDLDNLAGDDLHLEVGLGRIVVVVPEEGLNVEVDATVEGGEVSLFGDRSSSSDTSSYGDDPTDPTLTIDAEVLLGEIQISTRSAR